MKIVAGDACTCNPGALLGGQATMVTVFIWERNYLHGLVGHAAMQIGLGPNGYVSWWPGAAGSGGAKGALSGGLSSLRRIHTHNEDVVHYRDLHVPLLPPIQISCLDEQSMSAWWARKRTATDRMGHYTFLDQNCAFTVVEGLRIGGAFEKLGDIPEIGPRIYAKAWSSWSTVWSPREVGRLARALSAVH